MTNTDKTVSTISDELLASMINEAANEEWEDMALALRELQSLREASRTQEPAEWQVEAAKLQAFKDYVHKRLDDVGIPAHPDGEHSKAGCRIGDRLDIALRAASITPPASERSKEEVTDQDIDRAARAAFAASYPAGRHPWPWDDADAWGKDAIEEQEWWRNLVRAALSALEPAPLHKGDGEPRLKTVRSHKHTCANVQAGSTHADKCDCGALDTAGNAIEVVASPAPLPVTITDELERNILAWVRDDVLPAYGITHNTRASDPEMVEGLRAALSKPWEQG